MDDRRRSDRRRGSRRKSDRIKRMIFLTIAAVAFILMVIKITSILLSSPLPTQVIFMGLTFPVIVTIIVIIILIVRIKEAKSESAFDFKGLSLIIAEANIVNREILSAILEKTGISFELAENGNAVISLLEGNLCKYNMIFMDVDLPEMDGYETTRAIRFIGSEWAKKIPIIAMLAHPTRGVVESCLSAGMNTYIEKPFDPDNVCLTIQKRALFFSKEDEIREKFEQGVAWNEGLALGDELVDTQHHKLFGLVSGLVNECSGESNTVKLKETLDFVVNFTTQHFCDEEALMLRCRFSGYKKHKLMHEEIKTAVDDLVKRFETSGSSKELSDDLIKILVRWLTSHIMYEDKKIVSHIRNITIKKLKSSQK